MTQVVRILQVVAKVAEFLGAAAAVILAAIADGKIDTHEGQLAVIAAAIALVGHAITHTTEGTP